MPRLTIGRRFGVVALLVVPLVASVCVIGAIGVSRMNSQVSELYRHGQRQTHSARLARSLTAVEAAVLRGVLSDDREGGRNRVEVFTNGNGSGAANAVVVPAAAAEG